ncbi:hypothetical protein HKI87_08g53270 [Chloropicon roscoffensis]|uniref:Secreted protein n=1 Tax=Chloropicon roscoffensis TaxID=1461544 RepID=A0AAX4PCI0_9CHLO
MLRKFAVVMAAVLAVQSVAAVRTEPKLKPEHSPVVLNQKLEGSWKWEVTFDIFEGLVQGFFEYDKYPNLKQCASDITEVYDDLDQAIEDIKEKSVDGVKEGIKLIGESLTEVSNAITDCKGAVEDVENILSVLKEFSSPYSFAFHVGKDLLVNGVNIIHEISAAIDDWDAQSYRDCGVQIGTALNQLLIGAEEQN